MKCCLNQLLGINEIDPYYRDAFLDSHPIRLRVPMLCLSIAAYEERENLHAELERLNQVLDTAAFYCELTLRIGRERLLWPDPTRKPDL